MNDVEYILRIILEARDKMAAVLQKARTQIRAFARDADTMNASVTNLNQAMKNFDNNMDNITKKMESWRAIIRDAADGNKKMGKSLDDVGKSADKAARSTRTATETQKQLQDRARAYRQEIRDVAKAHEEGNITTELALAKYKKLGKGLDEISLKMSEAARKRTPAHHWVDEVEVAINDLKRIDSLNEETARKREKEAKDHEALIKRVYKEHADAAVRAYKIEQEAAAEANRESEKAAKDHEALVRRVYKEHADAAVRAYQEEVKAADTAAKQTARIQERARIGRGGGSPAEIRRLAAEYDRLSRSYEVGSREARQYANEAERLRATIRRTSSDTDRGKSAFDRLSAALNKSHGSAAGFDNQMRGIGILAAVASIDQLISAAIALGGELVSLAGSAAMAGGALGGILAAGAAQALPVMGLLAGAVQRVGAVMEAMTAQQQLQKAQATDAEKGGQKAIDQANTIANANDAVADANDRLAESRKALTDANEEGTDQLQDLILAEKQAALAAKGAALDVKSAQEALRLAVREGASQLEIDQKRQALEEAKLGKTQAGVGARRATRERRAAGGDVGNLESVQAAAKQVEEAEKAVTRANRALDQAEDKANRAAGSTMTAAANLNFILSQLSPAERKLYTALQSTYDTYKKIFQGEGTGGSGIYGVIINSFTRAVDKVNDIMKMPEVVAGIQDLADVIGENIDKIVDAVDPAVIEQLLTIVGDAGDNLGPVVDMAIKLGQAFLNIAETANPALQELIKYLGPIVDDFLKLTSDKDKMEDFFKTGEEHLESWLDLILAVIGLFAALTGASAEEGKTSIDDLTEKIKGWTDWIDDHHDQVVAFFEDARKAAYAIGGVLENLAVTLFKTFSAERVEKFAGILNDIVIPALGDFINLIGELTDWVAKLLENPVIAQLAKWAIAFLLITKLAGPILGVFAGAAKSVLSLGKGLVDLGKGIVSVGRWLGNLGKHLDNVVKFFSAAIKVVSTFIARMQILGVVMTAAGGKAAWLGRALTLAFGPWGLIIAAVIVGVLLLLKHFGKLDDIWNAIKEAASGFLKDIEPAIKALQEALGGLGIKIDSLKDVLKFLEVAGKYLADFIATYLIGMIQGMFKVLAGVATFLIRTIAGLINILHGVADILIGIFTLDWEQIKKGFSEIADGIVDIFWGVVDGVKLAFEGLLKMFLAPWKAAWNAVKDFFGIKSPSTKAKELGKNIIEGFKDGFVGLVRWMTAPYRRAWNAINNFFDGKPKKLAESIIDEFVDRMKVLWRRVRGAASYLWEKFKDAWDAAKKFGGTIVNAIVEGFKGLPGALLKAVDDIASQLLDIGKAIGNKIVEGVKSAFGAVKGFIGDLIPGGGDDKKDGKKPAAGGGAKPQSTVKFDIGVGAIPFGAKDLKDAENMYGEFWAELRRDARNSTDYIQRQFREMRIATTGSSDKMYKDIRSSLRDIQNSFKVRGAAAGKNWEKTWLDFQKTAYSGLNYIGQETNKALKGFGAKAINFGLSVPTGGGKGGEEKAVGGWIGNQGERGRDTVHAVLGRGEAVLNWAHQRVVEPALNAMYGFGLEGLFGHTRALHSVPATNGRGFAEGGSTDTRLARLIATANRVDAMHLPYVWGGGHQQPAQIGSGMDCSGSVSYVVQQAGYKVPTVTSGAMPSWGFKPGSDGATVYYNPEHTFMRIGSKYFGTTGFGHPGWTGAGWFTRAPSADYLSGFSTIHLPGITDVGGFATGVGGEIAKLIVRGAKGAAKTLMQKAFDLVVPKANTFIGEQSSQFDPGSGQPGDEPKYADGVLTAGQVGNFIRQALGILNISKDVSMWVQTLTRQASRESSFNPNAINNWDINAQRGDPSIGLVQIIGSNFRTYKEPGHDNIRNPLDNLLAVIKYTIARYGNGDATRAVSTLWGRGGGAYAEGGEIPGAEGDPVPILAHAREWVLNPKQQGILSRLVGTGRDTLKAMLGFTGGPFSFQGGGEVKKRREAALKAAGKVVTAVEVDLSDDLMQNVAQSLADLRGLMRAVPKIKKITNSVKPIIDLIELATKDQGFLDQLRGSIEAQFARTALRLRQARFDVQRGTGGQRVRVVERRDAVQQAQAQLTATVGQRDELTDERRAIREEAKLVALRLKDRKVKGDARRKLVAQQIALNTRLGEADERVQQNEEDIFAAQEELARAREEAAQKLKDDFQETIDKLKEQYNRKNASAERLKRVATALGNPELLESATNSIANNMQENVNQLQERLSAARAAGYTDIATGLEEDIAELQTSILEFAQQRLRDAMEVISTAATRRGAVLDLFGRMADAMGLVGQGAAAAIPGVGGVGGLGSMTRAGVAQGRIDAARTEQAGYVGLLGQAQAAGNVGLAQELTDKINELTVVIVEQTKAARDAKFAATQESFDYNTSINDLTRQLVEATDAATKQTSTAELLRLAQERLALYSARTIEIQAQLDEAIREGDVKATQDLTKQLLENQIAVQNNTKAVEDITGAGSAPASYTSSAWQWFRSALLTGTGGVMPQYTPPTMQSYNTIGPAGTSTTTNNGATIVNNFEINEAGQPIDTTQLANAVGFAQATAQ